jgi:hypothetical protein
VPFLPLSFSSQYSLSFVLIHRVKQRKLLIHHIPPPLPKWTFLWEAAWSFLKKKNFK